ncbi:MAG: SDR family NAD(P)-dependent oxidoreductase [Sandaracinaceae bacterium]
MGALDGKHVVVLGGGRGVGRAEALACAREGASVVVNDLGCDPQGAGSDPSVAREVAHEIEAMGGRALPDASDIATPGAVGAILSRATSAFGPVDAVVSAAGAVLSRTVLKMDDAILDRVMEIHVRASFALVRASARAFIDAGRPGAILLHTAPIGFFGGVRQSALAAASGATAALVRCAAIELRKHDVRVNAIAPTARTRTTEDTPLFTGIAANSMSPDFVAPVAVHLISDAAREVSGEVIGVAGARIYALGGRETPGWFTGGAPATQAELAAGLAEALRS